MNPKQDTHKITPRYIINTVLKTSDEENILNSSQSERHVTQRGTEFKMLELVKRTEWPTHELFFPLKPSSPHRRMEPIFALNYLLSYKFTFVTQKATYSIAGKDWSFQSKSTDDLSKILNVRDKVEAEKNQMLGHSFQLLSYSQSQ